MRPPIETASGLAAVLRGVVADMQHASKADIVSIFLYEESSRTYYAPFATGQPQESLLDSLTDMREQLARYSSDMSQGKVPDDFSVHHYGSTVWLTVTRQKLVARDAATEIDSTFIRRYQVQATIGLALLSVPLGGVAAKAPGIAPAIRARKAAATVGAMWRWRGAHPRPSAVVRKPGIASSS